MGGGRVVFKRESQVRESVVIGDRLVCGEAITIQQQMYAKAAGEDVDAFAQTIVRDNFGETGMLRNDAAPKGIATEDGTADDDSGRVA